MAKMFTAIKIAMDQKPLDKTQFGKENLHKQHSTIQQCNKNHQKINKGKRLYEKIKERSEEMNEEGRDIIKEK